MGEQSVVIHLSLGSGGFGSEEARNSIRALKREIEEVLAVSGLGELDGDEFGDGDAVLYLYGPDAERLFAAVEPLTRAWSPGAKYAFLRYGRSDDPDFAERRVDF